MFYNIKIKSNKGEYALESYDKDIIQREMDLYFASMYEASEEFKSKIKNIQIETKNAGFESQIEQLRSVRENIIQQSQTQYVESVIQPQPAMQPSPAIKTEPFNQIQTNVKPELKDIGTQEVQIKPVENRQIERMSPKELQFSSYNNQTIQTVEQKPIESIQQPIEIKNKQLTEINNNEPIKFVKDEPNIEIKNSISSNEISINSNSTDVYTKELDESEYKSADIQQTSDAGKGIQTNFQTFEIEEIKFEEPPAATPETEPVLQNSNIQTKTQDIKIDEAELNIKQEIKTPTSDESFLEEINLTSPSMAYEKLQSYANQEVKAPEINISNNENQIQGLGKIDNKPSEVNNNIGELQFIGEAPSQEIFADKPASEAIEENKEETKSENSLEGLVKNIQNKVDSIDITSESDEGNLLGAFANQDIPTLELSQQEVMAAEALMEENVIDVRKDTHQEPIEKENIQTVSEQIKEEKPHNHNNQILDFKLFLSGFVVNELADKFLICAYYVKNILKQDSFSIKFINSKLFVATGEIADMSIVDELIVKEYLKQVKSDEFVQYTITPEGERYFSATFQV